MGVANAGGTILGVTLQGVAIWQTPLKRGYTRDYGGESHRAHSRLRGILEEFRQGLISRLGS